MHSAGDRSAAPNSILGRSDAEAIVDRFERALFAGQKPRLEDYLTADQPYRCEILEELVHIEVEYKGRQREIASLGDYLGRFPELAQDPQCVARLRETYERYISREPDTNDAALASISTFPRDPVAVSTVSAPPKSPFAQRFGDYELLEEIARGGMGVVYKARQMKLNRLVALKMILAGQLAGPEHIKRFYAEAEAAGQLDHPGIVPIFEVGQHSGQHFFSMGYIEGRSLAGRVADGPLPPAEAAQLVHEVALAVQYAHDKGVVHRDLKPGNILLDQQGRPRVADFGLAKLTSRESELTGTGQILGTPSYMPPEQASGNLEFIGPLADVYSLGAILYCLLTGRPPFQAASALETIQQVQKQEPVRLRQLNSQLPIDLETITHKCLEKDRSKRYPSAQIVAEELQRYLDGRPILARPVRQVELLWRWCRRNPRVATLSGAIVVLLASLAFGSTAAAMLIRFEQGKTDAAAKRADRNAREARRAVNDYFTRISEETLLNQPGLQQLQHQLLDRARQYYESFVEEHTDDPTTQVELAETYARLGRISKNLGQLPDAVNRFQQSLKTYESYVHGSRLSEIQQRFRANIYTDLADVQHTMGLNEAALQSLEMVQGLLEELASQHPSQLDFQYDRSRAYHVMALVAQEMGNTAAERDSLNKGRDIMEQVVVTSPLAHYRNLLGAIYMSQALATEHEGDVDEAMALMQKTIEIRAELTKVDPKQLEYRFHLARSYLNRGTFEQRQYREKDAFASYEVARQILEKLVAENRLIVEYQTELAFVHNNIGAEQMRFVGIDEGIASFQHSLDIYQSLAAEYPEIPKYQVYLGMAYAHLGVYEEKPGEKLRMLELARITITPVVNNNPRNAQYQTALSMTLCNLGNELYDLERYDEAINDFRDSIERLRQLLKVTPNDPQTLDALKSVYHNMFRALGTAKRPEELVQTVIESRDVLKNDPFALVTAAIWPAHAIALVETNPPSSDESVAGRRKEYAKLSIDLLEDAISAGLPSNRVFLQAMVAELTDFAKVLADSETARRFNDLTTSGEGQDDNVSGIHSYRRMIELCHELRAKYGDAPILREMEFVLNRLVGDMSRKANDLPAAKKHYLDAVASITDRPKPTKKSRSTSGIQDEVLTNYISLDLQRGGDVNAIHAGDLATVYLNLGEVTVPEGGPTEGYLSAGKYFRKCMEIAKTVPVDDTHFTKLNRALCLGYLGSVVRREGKAQDGLGYFETSATLYQEVATANPEEMEAFTGLASTYSNRGRLEMEAMHFEDAIRWFELAVQLLERLSNEGKLKDRPANRAWIPMMKQELEACRLIQGAIDDLNFALKQPRTVVPTLLVTRATVLARRGLHEEAAETASKLKERARGKADNLYNVACCYSLCIPAVAGGKPVAEKTDDERTATNRYTSAALEALTEAVDHGYKDLTHMERDPDLDAIRDQVVYKQLVDRLKAPRPTTKSAPDTSK